MLFVSVSIVNLCWINVKMVTEGLALRVHHILSLDSAREMFSLDPRLAFGVYFRFWCIGKLVPDTFVSFGNKFPETPNSEAESRVQGNHFPAGVKGQRPL